MAKKITISALLFAFIILSIVPVRAGMISSPYKRKVKGGYSACKIEYKAGFLGMGAWNQFRIHTYVWDKQSEMGVESMTKKKHVYECFKARSSKHPNRYSCTSAFGGGTLVYEIPPGDKSLEFYLCQDALENLCKHDSFYCKD